MRIEQDVITTSSLPADIAEAESAAEDCVRLASTLLMLVEESQSDAATSLGQWREAPCWAWIPPSKSTWRGSLDPR